MIRASTLLPAFVLAFGLAGTSLAMANDSKSDNTTQHHAATKAAGNSNSCSDAPMYENPAYCQPHGK